MKKGLFYIIGGVFIFRYGQAFIVRDTRLTATGIGLGLALIGVAIYAAEIVIEYLERKAWTLNQS